MDELTERAFAPDVADLVARSWDEDADDRLRLIFTCAHPALPLEGRVALTLRSVAGLTTPEIARAFLVPESTMAQRIVRAKRRIADTGIPFRVPPLEELPERLDGVLAVLYLVFTEGYSATSGERLLRIDLAAEAIRLARLTLELVPPAAQDEARALLALMLLQHSRRDSRTDAAGDVVPFERQDRARWDRASIREAQLLLDAPYRVRGAYRLQAEIARAHAADTTDWVAIATLYVELQELSRSPFVDLNLAIARGFAEGPESGLAALDALEAGGALAGYHLLPAAQADLLRRAGQKDAATRRYGEALALAPTEAERRYLTRRLRELGHDV